jgi:signal transduction histidine kinase
MAPAGGDKPMMKPEQSREGEEEALPDLLPLRQCLSELALVPAVHQTISKALAQSEELLRQRLAQTAEHAQRGALLGEIATRMVHDIRNPLNAIFLHADVVEEELRRPTQDSQTQMAASVAEIRTEVTRLYDLMQDYLTLARLAVVQREFEDLGLFLGECAHAMRTQLESRRIVLHLEGLTRLGRVAIHKGTLRRAIINLMQRALDAMPQGGTLTLRGRRAASSHVTIEVRDTGRHIPEEQLERLFEPFCTTESEWTGLELYVVREIVAVHHGTIDVQSAPHQGTTFTITLPLVTVDTRRTP